MSDSPDPPLVAVLNGPNMNMLGLRQPHLYGSATLGDVEQLCAETAEGLGLAIDFRQTNGEGELISWVQECRGRAAGIVINPAGIGSTVKMVNQLLAGVHIATAAEAMALGIRAGADPRTLFDVISSSAGSSWMFQNRVPHILAGDDTPLSAVNIFVKDLGIVLDQARALTFPLPMASAAHQLFLAAAANGQGGKDDAFVIRFWQALAGIDLPEKQES